MSYPSPTKENRASASITPADTSLMLPRFLPLIGPEPDRLTDASDPRRTRSHKHAHTDDERNPLREGRRAYRVGLTRWWPSTSTSPSVRAGADRSTSAATETTSARGSTTARHTTRSALGQPVTTETETSQIRQARPGRTGSDGSPRPKLPVLSSPPPCDRSALKERDRHRGSQRMFTTNISIGDESCVGALTL